MRNRVSYITLELLVISITSELIDTEADRKFRQRMVNFVEPADNTGNRNTKSFGYSFKGLHLPEFFICE